MAEVLRRARGPLVLALAGAVCVVALLVFGDWLQDPGWRP